MFYSVVNGNPVPIFKQRSLSHRDQPPLCQSLEDDMMEDAQEKQGEAALVGLVRSTAVSLYSLQVNLTFS